MRDDPASREEHKFDTLSLLAGLSEEDTGRYSIYDILSEFGGWTENKKDGSASPNASPDPAAAGAARLPFPRRAEGAGQRHHRPDPARH